MSNVRADSAPADRYVTIEGVRLRYWQGGAGDRVVILVQGVGSYIERWRHTFDVLRRRFRVYALDLPGLGLSDKPADFCYHVTNLARFVRLFAGMMGLASASLVGSSLGGAVVAHYARVFPDDVEQLVLSSSAGWGRRVSGLLRIAGLPGIGELLGRRQGRESARRLLLRTVRTPAVVTEELVDLEEQMSAQPDAWKAALRLLRANGNLLGQSKSVFGPLRRDLRDFAKPVLILWGDRDNVLTPAHARIAKSVLPHAEIHLFEGCGHMLMLERPDEYASLLLSFIERPFNGSRS